MSANAGSHSFEDTRRPWVTTCFASSTVPQISSAVVNSSVEIGGWVGYALRVLRRYYAALVAQIAILVTVAETRVLANISGQLPFQ